MTARAGVEPTTLRLKVIDSTKAPSRPTNGTGRKKSYGDDLEKEETLDRSYTQRRKPAEGGNRGSVGRKMIKGKEMIGYAE